MRAHGGLAGRDRASYVRYRNMLARCYNPKTDRYGRYCARGIKVCDRWLYGDGVKSGFVLFMEDIGPRPSPKHSLDRINNDGDYEPGNVRWALPVQQANNTGRNVFIEINGTKMTMAEWCRHLGVPERRVRKRVARGLSFQHALLAEPQPGVNWQPTSI